MKKYFLSSLLFLVPSFLLSALQGNLYFLPFSLPMFWCIFTAFYSFRKSLMNSLFLNLFHTIIIISFTTVNPSQLILTMNIFTLFCFIIRERFHTNLWYITLASSAMSFLFLFSQWFFTIFSKEFYFPSFLSWVGISLATGLFAPLILMFLDKLDQRIQIEKVETLENLRI